MCISASEHIEEFYVYNKFMNECLGTNNLESSARLCWASGVVGAAGAATRERLAEGLATALGFALFGPWIDAALEAPPNPMEIIDRQMDATIAAVEESSKTGSKT